MKNKPVKSKTIILKKKDALNFFGDTATIANSCNVTFQAVSKWPDIVPDGSAWALHWVSLRKEYRDKGKLPVIINI